MAISKRLRFEIYRRDNHACRYCGAAAPHATLTIDHVVPVALGGTGEPSNLVTACVDCNAGKSSTSPDAPVIEDVSADAIRWGNALKYAARLQGEAELEEHIRQNEFAREWGRWTLGGEAVPMPANWRYSVAQWTRAGLSIDELIDLIPVAMRVPGVTDRFRYFAGCAWRRVGDRHEIARALLDSGEC